MTEEEFEEKIGKFSERLFGHDLTARKEGRPRWLQNIVIACRCVFGAVFFSVAKMGYMLLTLLALGLLIGLIKAIAGGSAVPFLTGCCVAFGVFLFFAAFRYLADILIFAIAISDAILAGYINHWYGRAAEAIPLLPPEYCFKGWAICVVGLALIGALVSLPLIPFSSIPHHSGFSKAKPRE